MDHGPWLAKYDQIVTVVRQKCRKRVSGTKKKQQEFIPLGCTPPATVAVSGGGGA